MTILGAMSLRGMVATMTIEEATDADIFLADVKQILCPTLKPGDVVVMDNLNSQEALYQAIEEALKLISPDNARAWFNHCFDGLQ
jgi:predicted transglutaminase-like cysteine proteinase